MMIFVVTLWCKTIQAGTQVTIKTKFHKIVRPAKILKIQMLRNQGTWVYNRQVRKHTEQVLRNQPAKILNWYRVIKRDCDE